MAKKCMICGGEAEYKIKGSSDYYCKDCAEDYFSDISLLVKVEEDAKKIKKIIEERYPPSDEDEPKIDEDKPGKA